MDLHVVIFTRFINTNLQYMFWAPCYLMVSLLVSLYKCADGHYTKLVMPAQTCHHVISNIAADLHIFGTLSSDGAFAFFLLTMCMNK